MAHQDDYFTHEVIRNGLLALGDEMFDALKRTSKSPIIYETLDFAVGLTDAKANLVTQGNGVTGFLGTLDAAVREVLGKHGDHLQADDIYLTNDPYGGGGTHLSDVTLVKPVFADGQDDAGDRSHAERPSGPIGGALGPGRVGRVGRVGRRRLGDRRRLLRRRAGVGRPRDGVLPAGIGRTREQPHHPASVPPPVVL